MTTNRFPHALLSTALLALGAPATMACSSAHDHDGAATSGSPDASSSSSSGVTNGGAGGGATATSTSGAGGSTGTSSGAGGSGSGGGAPTDGYTTFPGLPGTPGGYAQALYVDSVAGSDDNDGSSPDKALGHVDSSSKLYKTLTALGDGASVIVLLKPGSDFGTEVLQVPVAGTADFPLLVSGSKWPGVAGARPSFQGVQIKFGDGKQSHVAIESLHLAWPGHSAVEIDIADGTDYLVEDCVLENSFQILQAGTGDVAHPMTNIRVRRNYLLGANGSGPALGMYIASVETMLIEENVFDYNGGDGDYASTNLYQPTNNMLSHDIYVGANSDGKTVTARDFTIRRNLFSRSMQAVKGPYTGVFDDNLFYDYTTANYGSAWSYVGPQGVTVTNNVLVNGPGLGTSVDNGHAGTGTSSGTTFCNNLLYNEQDSYEGGVVNGNVNGYAAYTAGVTLNYVGNIIDGLGKAMMPEDSTCGGYTFKDNVFQSSIFYWFNPLSCGVSASGNLYYSSKGPDGDVAYGNAANPQNMNFAQMETFLKETNGTFNPTPIPFADPTRNMGSYLTANGMVSGGATPTLIDYLKLVMAQSATAHAWDTRLAVTTINAYLRAGHAMPGRTFAYSSTCQ
jgi:hypothetical protein